MPRSRPSMAILLLLAALQWSCRAPRAATAAAAEPPPPEPSAVSASPTSPPFVAGLQRVGTLTDPLLTESSGLVAVAPTPASPIAFWTLNDSGNAPLLFALDERGATLLQLSVAARNLDWEDLASDAQGRLYIADTGNNQRRRTAIHVHRITLPSPTGPPWPIPNLTSKTQTAPAPDRTWTLRYPDDQPFDCEALFIHHGSAYLVSKHWYDRPAGLYRFALNDHPATRTLEHVADLPIRDPVTGAAISPDGRRLALVSYAGLWVFPIDNDPAAAATAIPLVLRFAIPGLEAVTFADDQTLYLTTEARALYRCVLPAD